jgi:GNAT superfamily N-acetyltransferase
MRNWTTRRAHPVDAPAIARVHVDSWRTTYRGIVPASVLESLDYASREEMWRRVTSDTITGQFAFVAENADHHIIGFVSGGPERSGEYDDYAGEIYTIYLDAAYQGQGIGRQLMETGVRALLERGHTGMLIWVLTENPTCGFYRHLGGVPVATKDITMGRKTLEETAFGWKDITGLVEDRGPIDR